MPDHPDFKPGFPPGFAGAFGIMVEANGNLHLVEEFFLFLVWGMARKRVGDGSRPYNLLLGEAGSIMIARSIEGFPSSLSVSCQYGAIDVFR
jgi:hypothetical protein